MLWVKTSQGNSNEYLQHMLLYKIRYKYSGNNLKTQKLRYYVLIAFTAVVRMYRNKVAVDFLLVL